MTDQAPRPASGEIDPQYVAARRVLLDALTGLAPQARAVILVGAQAIYLRTGSADLTLTVAPFTTDGDLAVDPAELEDVPELESAMRKAGLELLPQDGGRVEPGMWYGTANVKGQVIQVPIDLIVPDAVAGRGTRAARLGVHGDRAARRAVGLEAALVDHGQMTITALEPDDHRSIATNVAGPAALFVAKLHKLHDRVASAKAHRLEDKDAGDVIRLMQATSYEEVGTRLAWLTQDEVAGTVTAAGVEHLRELFGRRGAVGIQMAARSLRLGMPPERVEALSLAYTAALVRVAGGRST